MPYSGSCLCKAVRYTFDAEPRVVVNCHCSLCRKATGSTYATWALVPREHFQWTAGAENLRQFASSDHGSRFFCSACGSTLGNLTHLRPTVMHLAAGTLDNAPEMRAAFHVYVGSKASWHEITDALPQHHELPPRPAPTT
jgi:hypothetical protein